MSLNNQTKCYLKYKHYIAASKTIKSLLEPTRLLNSFAIFLDYHLVANYSFLEKFYVYDEENTSLEVRCQGQFYDRFFTYISIKPRV